MADYPDMPIWSFMQYVDEIYDVPRDAIAKSWKLFWDHLNDDQKQTAFYCNRIRVVGNSTKSVYIMNLNRESYNVGLHYNSNIITMYCVTTHNKYVPMWDKLLVQKLLLETYEEDFLQTAFRKTFNKQIDDYNFDIVYHRFTIPL